MSQLYKIRLKDSVSRIITASDCVDYPIELTEVLPEEEMIDILKGVLKEKGFEQIEENIFVKEGSVGEKITVNLEDMKVTAELESAKEVIKEVEIDTHIDADSKREASWHGQEMLKRQKERASRELENAERHVQKELTGQLLESEEERLQELNTIMQEVYAESLKRKAGSLGEVTSLNESMENGEYRLDITVEL